MSMINGFPIYSIGSSVISGSNAEMFGTGADGDLVIASGETVTLSVSASHLSIVEMNYNTINIEDGGTLICDTNNNGLILRCKGDCVINGTIDQSAKSGIPNPSISFDYPDEIACGNGGDGGDGNQDGFYGKATGGTAMEAHKGGGGWSGGGAGGCTYRWNNDDGGSYDASEPGFDGGSVNNIATNVSLDDLFKGGEPGNAGTYGGGGSGYFSTNVSSSYTGAGASGAGGNAQDTFGTNIKFPGGGAGNYGGGVVMLYAGRNCTINGYILCNGGNGGNGGSRPVGNLWENGGSGGGGGGGGAFYCVYKGAYTNYGSVDVNGGFGGKGNGLGTDGDAGTPGSITVKKYENSMTK